MRAAVYNRYGPAAEVIEIVDDAPKPVPGADQVLVRVIATSVNPIDCAVRSGYGKDFFWEKDNMTFPVCMGRDIAGIVEAVGAQVSGFQPGDAVYAGVLRDGTAEYAVVDAAHVAHKPKRLSFVEAASMPYVALTTWSALVDRVGLTAENTAGKRVVIPRGAGGVGSFAIQLMKAWGAEVATICSTRNVDLVRSLGADIVVDYKKDDFAESLHEFDVAFDTAFDTEEKLLGTLRQGANAMYVSIVTPKIHMMDQYGVEEGLARANAYLQDRQTEQGALGRRYDWSFMEPNGAALTEIAELVDAGKIRAVVDRVYPMDKIAEGHDYCETKQAQGKIVIQVAEDPAA